jgi:hypothetical protein
VSFFGLNESGESVPGRVFTIAGLAEFGALGQRHDSVQDSGMSRSMRRFIEVNFASLTCQHCLTSEILDKKVKPFLNAGHWHWLKTVGFASSSFFSSILPTCRQKIRQPSSAVVTVVAIWGSRLLDWSWFPL